MTVFFVYWSKKASSRNEKGKYSLLAYETGSANLNKMVQA